MKKYRLLQDYRTPTMKIDSGAIFIRKYLNNPNLPDYYEYEKVSGYGDGFAMKLSIVDVEYFPTWFEEVKEPQESFLHAHITRNSILTVHIPSEYTGTWDFSIPEHPTLTLTRKY